MILLYFNLKLKLFILRKYVKKGMCLFFRIDVLDEKKYMCIFIYIYV